MHGVVLAGGDGTRFSRFGCCKPLLRINGRYVIEYALDSLNALGAQGALIVVGKYGDRIASALGDAYGSLPLRYVRQTQPLGLVNALFTAAPLLRGQTAAMLLGDEIFIGPTPPAASVLTQADFWCGYTVPADPASIRGNYSIVCGADNTVLTTEEKPQTVVNEKKGTGFCAFNAPCIDVLLSEYAETGGAGQTICDYINLLTARGKRGLAVEIAAEEININGRADYAYARRRLSKEADA